jgi:HEPN domain-containing protein
MNSDEFHKRMSLIDKELAEKGVPIHARAFHAFPIFSPNYHGPILGYGIDSTLYKEYEGPNLLDKINIWYKNIYGDRFNAPTDRGKVPILIKNEIYIIRIPLVYGSPKIEILPLINGLTPAMAKILSTDELNEIQKRFIEGYSLVYEFEDLMSQLDAEERKGIKRKENPFLSSALRDRDTAVDCLEGAIDTNGAVFHSQQLTEKMLKAVMFYSKGMDEENIRKKYNHRILDIFNDICNFNSVSPEIRSEVQHIAQYKMEIRYMNEHIPKAEAVRSYWAGLRVGGWCSTLLSGHKRRIP